MNVLKQGIRPLAPGRRRKSPRGFKKNFGKEERRSGGPSPKSSARLCRVPPEVLLPGGLGECPLREGRASWVPWWGLGLGVLGIGFTVYGLRFRGLGLVVYG